MFSALVQTKILMNPFEIDVLRMVGFLFPNTSAVVKEFQWLRWAMMSLTRNVADLIARFELFETPEKMKKARYIECVLDV